MLFLDFKLQHEKYSNRMKVEEDRLQLDQNHLMLDNELFQKMIEHTARRLEIKQRWFDLEAAGRRGAEEERSKIVDVLSKLRENLA